MPTIPLNKFGLTERDFLTIETIFKKHPKVTHVIIFGSRAKGNYKLGSDIDLAIMNKGIDTAELAKIKNDFSESSLPYMVDLVLYDKLTTPEFIEHINRIGYLFIKI